MTEAQCLPQIVVNSYTRLPKPTFPGKVVRTYSNLPSVDVQNRVANLWASLRNNLPIIARNGLKQDDARDVHVEEADSYEKNEPIMEQCETSSGDTSQHSDCERDATKEESAVYSDAECDTQASQETNTVTVTFAVKRETMLGEDLHIVGNVAALGHWDPSAGATMRWTDGHVWVTTVNVVFPIDASPKTLEYKYVLMSHGHVAKWESCDNHILPQPRSGSSLVCRNVWNDADTVVECCDEAIKLIQDADYKVEKPMNSAFVFIKPHAVTDQVKKVAKECLEVTGIKILAEGSLSGEKIDEKKLIDKHYYAIASKATILKPNELNVPADKFEAQFGITWQSALDCGKVFNAMDGCKYLGIDAPQMDAAWSKAKDAKKLVKFGGGFYCGLVEVAGKEPVYIFNGFFMAMRSKFTAPGTEIYWYSVEWDPAVLSWEDFRGRVLGPTDPAEAPKDSLRGWILANWKQLGLKSQPNVGDNGMHASASPFEAFAERNNWLGVPINEDPFGKMMLNARLSEDRIKEWAVDPQVKIEEGKFGSIFDKLEDMDAESCLNKVIELSDFQ